MKVWSFTLLPALFLLLSANGVQGQSAFGNQQNLDGQWNVVKDEADAGITGQWFLKSNYPEALSVKIPVPGNLWEALPYYADKYSWYSRSFRNPSGIAPGMKYYLRFDAVQYICKVWLNGCYLGEHEGGEVPFEFDVTGLLIEGDNFMAVRVLNVSNSSQFPVAYTVGGILGHVSLAEQPPVRIVDVYAKPDIHSGDINLEITVENNTGSAVAVRLSTLFGVHEGSNPGTVTTRVKVPAGQSMAKVTVNVGVPHLWCPSDPFLYSVSVIAGWKNKKDEYRIHHVGFKDFRITKGNLYTRPYFHLNNKRIYLKSTHSNAYDPRYLQATSRDYSILAKQFQNLKLCGYNMFRSISLALIPELIDLADEMGLMLWEEHAGSWFMSNPSKFVPSISGVIKRDRNHPSIAIWGCMNENTPLIDTARAYLPTLRKELDDTRLVCLSSGRFDMNGKQASFSNPGSSTWDAYLGGEDPVAPVQSFYVNDQFSLPPEQYISLTTGDIHTYSNWPVSWEYQSGFANIGANTKPVFLSEGGVGSLYDPISERAMLIEAGVPQTIRSWEWAGPWATSFENAWTRYSLHETYPDIVGMFVDSQKSQAWQRSQQLSMVRGNPNIMGFSSTGFSDTWGYPEGIMDNFGNMKAGLTQAMQEGWAPLKWCLAINPMSIYTNSTFKVKVELANEDFLAAGSYPATLDIRDTEGKLLWTRDVSITIPAYDAPLAYYVMNEDISVGGLEEGEYTLNAELKGIPNAAAHTLKFYVFSRSNHPVINHQVTVLGVSQAIRDLLKASGAILHEYGASEEIKNETIIAGDVTNDAATWRALYTKAAKGAHIVFLNKNTYGNSTNPNKWIAVPDKGSQQTELSRDLYHHEFVAKDHPIFNTLKTKVLTPDLYGQLLRCRYLMNITVPDDIAAVGFHDGEGGYSDGIMIGTYYHFAGQFTLNMMDLVGHVGEPVADRIILNMSAFALSGATGPKPLPPGYEAILDGLGIND